MAADVDVSSRACVGGNAVAERQRERILDALVQVVAERGFQGASVGLVGARAKISSRTFYELFDGLEDCFAGVLDLGLRLPAELIVGAFAQERNWRDGVRRALAALLVFFDSEPGLTRIWFGDALAAGSWALEHRERNIEAVQALIVEYWLPADARQIDEVLVRGVMSSILGAITTHVVTRNPEPLVALLAPLTSLIVTPFLDPHAVAEDVERARELTATLLVERATGSAAPGESVMGTVEGLEVSAALLAPRAHRARRCVLYLAEHPGASNSEVAAGVGVRYAGQISKLLTRLQGWGLVVKRMGGPGRPNAWRLTSRGLEVATDLETCKR